MSSLIRLCTGIGCIGGVSRRALLATWTWQFLRLWQPAGENGQGFESGNPSSVSLTEQHSSLACVSSLSHCMFSESRVDTEVLHRQQASDESVEDHEAIVYCAPSRAINHQYNEALLHPVLQ